MIYQFESYEVMNSLATQISRKLHRNEPVPFNSMVLAELKSLVNKEVNIWATTRPYPTSMIDREEMYNRLVNSITINSDTLKQHFDNFHLSKASAPVHQLASILQFPEHADRQFKPEFGSPVADSLFEPTDDPSIDPLEATTDRADAERIINEMIRSVPAATLAAELLKYKMEVVRLTNICNGVVKIINEDLS